MTFAVPRAFQSADENLSFIQFQILFFVQLQNKFSFPRNKSFVHFAFDARKFRASRLLDKILTGVVTDVVRMIEFYLRFDIANRINHWMRFAEEDHPIDRKKNRYMCSSFFQRKDLSGSVITNLAWLIYFWTLLRVSTNPDIHFDRA